MTAVILIVVIGTSIWVGIDAANIGAGKVGTGPVGWCLFCLLLWIIGFPVYLAKRSGIKAAVAASNAAGSNPGNADQVAQSPVGSPTFDRYSDPTAQGQQRFEAGTASSVASKADELLKLDALRQSGVLTQEEFNAEKAKLLGAPLPSIRPT